MSTITHIGNSIPVEYDVLGLNDDGKEVWKSLIRDHNYPGLAIVRPGLVKSKPRIWKPDSNEHHLVVSKNGVFFWFPSWSRITADNGWLNAIASNFHPTGDPDRRLFVKLCNLVTDELESCEKSGQKVPYAALISVVRDHIREQKLRQSRDLLLTNPDWSERYIVLNEKKGSPLILEKLKHPDPEILKKFPRESSPWRAFPVRWFVSILDRSLDATSGYQTPDMNQTAGAVDLVTSGNFTHLKNNLLRVGESRINRALCDVGLSKFASQNEPSFERRIDVLLTALGLTKPRDPYADYLENKIRSSNMTPNEVRIVLERPLNRIYSSWISAFSAAHGLTESDYFHLLNEKSRSGTEHRRESGIGSFVHFVELHRSRMNDEDYAIPIRQQFSKRVHSLMSERCLGMLKSLRLGLNHYSHSNDPMDPDAEARLVEILKNIGWANIWDSKRLGVKISEFINELYDVGGGLSSRVPVLMEVVAITETPTARLAELTSLRTKSKPSYINIDEEDRPRSILSAVDDENIKPPNPLRIGDRLMVLASTNPVLVKPWTKPM